MMSYRKSNVRSHLANIEKNRIVRQKCALRLLDVLEDGIEVFNVDESAIVSMYPCRKGWFRKWDTGVVTGKHLRSRVNLTLGVSSHGRCYYGMHC